MNERDTINIESATVLQQDALAGEQFILRLHSPEIAKDALPGSFVHLRCDEELPMRRPMSIMRADSDSGWIEILYKAHGMGTRLLSRQQTDTQISMIGPIGKPFRLEQYRANPLLIGGGVGIPPMVFLADHMRKQKADISPFVIMGSEVPFPFTVKPSQIMVPGVPADVIGCMPLLEDWGIPSRLASLQGYTGCFEGYVTDLARAWLDNLAAAERDQVEIFSCGPTPMLQAVALLAQEYELPCQISLEEYMACAVGGCAGCAVPVYDNNNVSMQRVCVDGPVFEASSIFPATRFQ